MASTVFFALREAGRIEPLSTNLDIFASPIDGSTPPLNLTDANDGTDNLPTVSPGWPHAGLLRDGARRVTKPIARCFSSAISPAARPAR